MFIQLDNNGPAYRQIYRQVREQILSGRLGCGVRLPSSRKLASDLGVARITVLQAYEQLTAEGYLETRSGAGTHVAEALGAEVRQQPTDLPPPTPRLSSRAANLMPAVPAEPPGLLDQPAQYDFQYGRPEVDAALCEAWRRAVRRAMRRLPVAYPDPCGDDGLRRCLAAYLRHRRGIVADPEQVLIVNGIQQALQLIGLCVLDPGDGVLIEDPHYQGARQAFMSSGARLVSLDVDDNGLQTEQLHGDSNSTPDARCKLAYVTPSHQFPLGGVLPVSRRLELLQWAEDNDAFIVEDDYDSEYRHQGMPLESLFGLDRKQRVVYLGTFSKVLFPALRLAYVVLPPTWVKPMRQLKWLADRGSAPLEQRALADLFRSGEFQRHVDRTNRILSRRRETLVAALHDHFGDGVRIVGERAGMHLVVRWPDWPPEWSDELVRMAAERGVGIYPTAPYYLNSGPTCCEVLMGYATLSTADILSGIRILRDGMAARNRWPRRASN